MHNATAAFYTQRTNTTLWPALSVLHASDVIYRLAIDDSVDTCETSEYVATYEAI